MATMRNRWELAVQVDGEWELCGDYGSREEAIVDAKRIHEQSGRQESEYGLSGDPQSGHYEESFRVWTESRTICGAEIR